MSTSTVPYLLYRDYPNVGYAMFAVSSKKLQFLPWKYLGLHLALLAVLVMWAITTVGAVGHFLPPLRSSNNKFLAYCFRQSAIRIRTVCH